MNDVPHETLIDDRIRVVVTDGVCRIRLSRPQHGNAIDLRMARAFLEAATKACDHVRSDAARVVVLEAEGKSFCVGGDLRFLSQAPSETLGSLADAMHRGISMLAATPAPVVSVVDGVAAGGGLGLALIADMVVASDRASLLSAYTAIGLSPDCGTSWQLARRLGPARAMDLVLTNRRLEADEALTWGLFNRVVPSADLTMAVDTVVTALARGSYDAITRAKALLYGAHSISLADHLDREAWALTRSATDGDGNAGIRAFVTNDDLKHSAN
jgi:2-(1,2-epoxy-1,2-dihydrophenyl)acetyl-CoA isomerase